MTSLARKSPIRGQPRNGNFQYVPVIHAEILYFRFGSVLLFHWPLI